MASNTQKSDAEDGRSTDGRTGGAFAAGAMALGALMLGRRVLTSARNRRRLRKAEKPSAGAETPGRGKDADAD